MAASGAALSREAIDAFQLALPADWVRLGLALGGLGFTRAACANLREKEDHWNAAISGAVGGALAGMART